MTFYKMLAVGDTVWLLVELLKSSLVLTIIVSAANQLFEEIAGC